MATTKALRIVYLADTKSVMAGLAKMDAAHAGFAQKLQSTGRAISHVGATLTKSITLPIVAMGALSVRAFDRMNQANAQTVAALKSTGGSANVTAKHIETLGRSLGNLGAQSHLVVQESLNVLLGFTKIRNEVGAGNKIYDEAALAISNVAARLGKDLKPVTIAVGKALQDPLHGLTGLVKMGVQFTDQQKAQIAAMVANGHQMEAQKLILSSLETRYRGAAKAAGDTAPATTKMRLALQKAGEQMGAIVVPVLQKLAIWVQHLASWFDHLSPAARRTTVQILAVAAVVGPTAILLGKMVTTVGILARGFQLLAGAAGLAAGAEGAGGLAALGAAAGPAAAALVLVGAAAVAVVIGARNLARSIQADSSTLATFGVHSGEAAGAQHRLAIAAYRANSAIEHQTALTALSGQAHRDWFKTLTGGTIGLRTFDDAMKYAHGVTQKQAEKIALLTSFLDTMGGQLTKAQANTLQASLAAGHYTAAVKLLNSVIDKMPPFKSTKITTPGAAQSISEVQRLHDLLAGLHGRQLSVYVKTIGRVAASGFHGMVSQPTTFLAGEAGAERVDITPQGGGSRSSAGGGIVVNIDARGSVGLDGPALAKTVQAELMRLRRQNGYSLGF